MKHILHKASTKGAIPIGGHPGVWPTHSVTQVPNVLYGICLSQDDSSTKMGIQVSSYHHFVQGQGIPPECQRFAVHDEACRVVDVAYL